MKKIICGAALAVLLVALGITVFKPSTVPSSTANTTNTTQTAPVADANITKPSAIADVTLTEANAKAIATEKLPDGYKAAAGTAVTIGKKDYYTFKISDAKGNSVGTIAIDRTSGDRYNYTDKGTIDDYSNFPLYQSSTDAVYDWNGTFVRSQKLLVELSQQDDQSFEYAFSDGTEGVARISGSKATSTDGALVFTFPKKNVLHVQDKSGTYTGSYPAKTPTE